MIKPKKPIAFVCAAALLLSPTGALGASPSDFVDFPNDWSTGAMTAAVDNGLLGGVGDGRIAPQGEVTRAQMAAIINRAFGAEKQASLSSYSDVAADAWYAVDMAKAVQMGTFSGTGNGLLEPDRAITREEAFSVLARAFALEAGDDSSLASFSDGAQVSSWAKGSVSAMVAAGYVNGSDGNRLNPQQTITRAEFAAVMSKIVAQYIDADSTLNRSLEIDGNVIVRGNVDLSGYTINGDVIIADEATNVTLDGVTVNGRLVVRGASDSLTISDSSADGVIITNPNGASVLKTDNASDLGTVTALGDLTLSGGQLDRLTIAESATITVEKGASVETITVSADDVTINGAGKVDKVQANADNVHVNVEDAEVTAGKGTSGVTAGDTSVAPGESATVSGDSDSDNDNENTGSNTGNGGSSGGNNNNPGGSTDTPGTDNPGGGNDNPGTTPGGGESTGDNTNPGGSEETPAAAIINAETTRLVDLGWSQYVVVQFADGHSLSDTKLTIDGTNVTSAFTPVTDDGSIVKWEITDLNPAQLVATSDGESQSDTLSNNTKPEKPKVETNTAPDYMIAHGAVPVWDYHLTNYDDEGNVRVEPAKTTFNLNGEIATDVPAFYSADAEISDGESFGSVKGEVVIQFAQETDADKEWFNAVEDNASGTVQLVSYNENKSTLNEKLAYTKGDGTITIALGQDNFRSNGRYYVRVKPTGHAAALVPIHVVNEKAPSLQLTGSGSAIQSNAEKVSFEISDMVYGITNPTYAAELSTPDGKTVALEMITDWYQIGDLLNLYNGQGKNLFQYNGLYTLTVHSNGFKDMECSFTVSGGEEVPVEPTTSARALNVDAVSRATSAGSGSSGEGGTTMSANLKFDADLLINAKLLINLGIANDAAQGIADRWECDMAGWDTVHTADGTAYNWTDFINAVNEAESKGDYLSFSEYTETASGDQTGTPYAIKSVLEDNLLGETQQNGTWIGMNPPTLTLVDTKGATITAVLEGGDVILKAEDADYFSKLQRVNINNNSQDLDKRKYSVIDDKLTIDGDALTLGQANSITLYADGYKANHLSVTYQRDIEQGLSLKADKETYESGESIELTVENSNGDFLEHLQSVEVSYPSGKNGYHIDKEGENVYASEAHYSIGVDGKTLTITDPDGKFFSEDGEYTITLTADGYNKLEASFGITAKSEEGEPSPEPGETVSAPTPVRAEKNSYGDQYRIIFSENGSNEAAIEYVQNITGIVVSDGSKDTTYQKMDGYDWTVDNTDYQLSTTGSDAYITLAGTGFNKDGNSTVTITANGYEMQTITIDKNGQIAKADQPESEAKEVPSYIAYKASTYFNEAQLIFDDESGTYDDEAESYLGAIKTVIVEETTYTAATSIYTVKDDNYYINIKDTGSYIELNDNRFNPDKNTLIVIKAEGYKDLTITIDKDGNLEK